MKRLVGILLALATVPALGAVDPGLVGTWQLQWVGPQMIWQVRADGKYRLIGTGARPNEHWGKIQAADGRWSSEWEKGTDQGSYKLQGNNWVVTATLGTGTWARIWPGTAASTASCPYVDIASIERHFGSAVSGRMIGKTCDLTAIKPGITDGVQILSEVINPAADTLRLHRAACANGTNRDPGTRCLQGVGDTAFFIHGRLYIYKNSSQIAISLTTYPANPAVNDEDAIAIGRLVLSRL